VAIIEINLELATGHGGATDRQWIGGVYGSGRNHEIKASDIDTALAEVREAVMAMSSPAAAKNRPTLQSDILARAGMEEPPTPPAPRPEITPRRVRGQRRTDQEPFLTDPAGSTERVA
jgi:hypothetical protein